MPLTTGEFYYNMVKLGFQEPELSRFLRKEWLVKDALSLYKERIPNPKTLNDFRNVDRMISLEGDMIVKVDRTSMLTSLECRAPFLNKNFGIILTLFQSIICLMGIIKSIY